jgi:hypothetical protein
MILLFQQGSAFYAKSFAHTVVPLALRLLSERKDSDPGTIPACPEQYTDTQYPGSKIFARVLTYGSNRAGQLLKDWIVAHRHPKNPSPNHWTCILHIS